MRKTIAITALVSVGLVMHTVSGLAQSPVQISPVPAVPQVRDQPSPYQPSEALNPAMGGNYYYRAQPGMGYPNWVTIADPAARKLHGEESELARSADELVHQLAAAKTDSEKDKVKTKLSEVLEKQFDLRQQRHAMEIAALEGQLKRLQDMVQKRQEGRRDIVSKRLDQLVREAQGLGW
jgi:hypothetical protein